MYMYISTTMEIKHYLRRTGAGGYESASWNTVLAKR